MAKQGLFLCGEFAGDDGKWHDGGYGASAHKCENCVYAARFYKVEGRKTRYRCARCAGVPMVPRD